MKNIQSNINDVVALVSIKTMTHVSTISRSKSLQDMQYGILHNTNVSFGFKPFTALNQRISYSLYYAKNCQKDGVFLQICGWMELGDLWSGAINDSLYQTKTDIFPNKCKFIKNDRVNDDEIPFTNIVDKGYHINLAAWRTGK